MVSLDLISGCLSVCWSVKLPYELYRQNADYVVQWGSCYFMLCYLVKENQISISRLYK